MSNATVSPAPAAAKLRQDRFPVGDKRRAKDAGKTRVCTYPQHQGKNPIPATVENFPVRKSDGSFVGWCRTCCKLSAKRYKDEPERQGIRPHTSLDPEAIKAVYGYVLAGWAVSRKDIIEGTGLDERIVLRALSAMEGSLVHSTHVNDEKALTYQTNYDVENDKTAKRSGTKALNAWLKARETPEPTPETTTTETEVAA